MSDIQVNFLKENRQTNFFVRGPHKLLHNSSMDGHLMQYYCFWICYTLPNKQFFCENILFHYVSVAKWKVFANRIWAVGHSLETPGLEFAGFLRSCFSPSISHISIAGRFQGRGCIDLFPNVENCCLCHLGAVIGTESFREQFVKNKVKWLLGARTPATLQLCTRQSWSSIFSIHQRNMLWMDPFPKNSTRNEWSIRTTRKCRQRTVSLTALYRTSG